MILPFKNSELQQFIRHKMFCRFKKSQNRQCKYRVYAQQLALGYLATAAVAMTVMMTFITEPGDSRAQLTRKPVINYTPSAVFTLRASCCQLSAGQQLRHASCSH